MRNARLSDWVIALLLCLAWGAAVAEMNTREAAENREYQK